MTLTIVNLYMLVTLVGLFGLFLIALRKAVAADPGVRGVAIGVAALMVAQGLLTLWLGLTGRLPGNPVPVGILSGVAVLTVGLVAMAASPVVRRLIKAVPLPWLLWPQIFRIAGGSFVMLLSLGLVSNRYWALTAGWGDVLAGVLAPIAIWAAIARPARWKTIVLAWNTFGLLDIVNAAIAGSTKPPEVLQPSIIVGFAVPFIVLFHVATYYRLVKTSSL